MKGTGYLIMRQVILKTAGANGALDAVRTRLAKAEAGMSLADVIAFFNDVFEALKARARKTPRAQW